MEDRQDNVDQVNQIATDYTIALMVLKNSLGDGFWHLSKSNSTTTNSSLQYQAA